MATLADYANDFPRQMCCLYLARAWLGKVNGKGHIRKPQISENIFLLQKQHSNSIEGLSSGIAEVSNCLVSPKPFCRTCCVRIQHLLYEVKNHLIGKNMSELIQENV